MTETIRSVWLWFLLVRETHERPCLLAYQTRAHHQSTTTHLAPIPLGALSVTGFIDIPRPKASA